MKAKVNSSLNSAYHNELKTEIAIVGAGVSGLYSGYRLLSGATSTLKGKDVQIFELSNRIGGRLESVELPGSNIMGELGGMRYLTSQKIVTALIEKVFASEMTPVDFQMGDESTLLMYLRKQRVKQNAWEEAQKQGGKLKTNYILDDRDVGFNSDQLFNRVVYDVLMQDPWFRNHPQLSKKVSNPSPYEYQFNLTSQDWDAIKPQLTYCFQGSPFYGRKVNDLGFWNLIKDQVSEEGYNFLADSGGYYSNTINWNAAEAFPYMVGDFSSGDVKYKTIKEGYDSIAYALATAYLNHSGTNIWSGNRLVTFNESLSSPYRYELIFFNQSSGKVWTVYANKIILALPRRSLELLDQENFFFSQEILSRNICSVIMEPSYKILMGFEYPWWKTLGIDAGHSITDLPLRQCYYFGVDKENDHALLLGSYGDMDSESFWKPLSDESEPFTGRVTPRASAERLSEFNDVLASKVMAAEILAQLKELHGPDVTIPAPYIALFKDWSVDPFGGGYHAWKACYSIKQVMEFMRKPLQAEDVHVCGEAYSDQQGWVEGAFCVAEKMLQDHFDMPWPDWLIPVNPDAPDHYYLGW